MKQELEDKLVAAYPTFFVGRAKPFTESRMAEGCTCDDGWYEIINDFCYLTKRTIDQARHVKSRDGKLVAHDAPRLEFVQIKEKLGTLRLYYKIWQPDSPDGNKDPQDIQKRLLEITHEIYGFKYFAYLLSTITCEITGKPGKLRIRDSLLKTLSREKVEELGFHDLPADHWLCDSTMVYGIAT